MGSLWEGILTHWSLIWFDVGCLATIVILLVSVSYVPQYQPSYRMVPMWPSPDNTMVYGPQELSHPYLEPFVPSWACGLIATTIPILIIGGFQITVCSWWDFWCGAFGNLKAVVFALVIQVLLKKTIGGFRPSFLDLCQPDFERFNSYRFSTLSNGLYYTNTSVCTGDEIIVQWALQSFPSGHSAVEFAAAIFTTLYINAKLKTFADFASTCWSISFTIAPLIAASSLAGGSWLAHTHHPIDIIFGMLIGLFAGMISYRSSYASLLDFRFNHIPLPPASAHMRFSYHAPFAVNDHSRDEIRTMMKLTNRLVGMDWWRKSDSQVDRETKSWARSMNSLRATGVDMKDANLEPNAASQRESSLEEALDPQAEYHTADSPLEELGPTDSPSEEFEMTSPVDAVSDTDRSITESVVVVSSPVA